MNESKTIHEEKIVALSFKEPYVSLLACGQKRIEIRSWNTNYRGPVLICASQAPYSRKQVIAISGYNRYELMCTTLSRWNVPDAKKFAMNTCGHAIAVGFLADCRPMTPEDQLYSMVNYNEKAFSHVYKDVMMIMPIPWKGAQGWQKVPDEIFHGLTFVNTEYTEERCQSILNRLYKGSCTIKNGVPREPS